VVNVPAKLSARVRALGGGSGRKTDDADAYAIAVAGLRGKNLQVVRPDDVGAVLKMLSDRRQQLVAQRITSVNRLHQLLQDLLPGGASRRLTAGKARELLSSVRPREKVAKTRKHLALEHLQDLELLDAKLKELQKRIADVLAEQPSSVQQIRGLGAVTTALILGEVGDARRFASKAHFASYTGTAPIDASSGDNVRHRLNRGGNRRLKLRPAHRRARPDPLPRRRPRLLPAQARRRQDPTGGDALPQASAVRRGVPRAARRPRPARC
jgi:transposase